MDDVIVVGGGPAGMFAAIAAGRAGRRVLLLERGDRLGRKLRITGKGRCNVTNTAENPLRSIVRNPRFLYAALAHFSSADLRGLLERYGCPTKEERGGRVFPCSDKASDVTRALERALREAGVRVLFHARVDSPQALPAHGAVVLATGGASYPATGSTGDGYALAAALGHTVLPPRPSLVPLLTREDWPCTLQGLALRNVRLSARLGKKTRFDELGEMLFTHFGISGPLVLSMSSHILDDDFGALDVRLDLKPGLTPEQTEKRLLRDWSESPRKRLSSLLPQLLPARLAALAPGLCGLDPDAPVGQISRQDRLRLAAWLKAVPLPVRGTRPLEEAIVTRGGVDVREVLPGTMMSRLREGLFFAGELLDVDAHTGGYNLQIAFSTGALAGQSAAEWAAGTA